MGEKFKKWVEESTEGQYVLMGSKCDLCGRKLAFLLPASGAAIPSTCMTVSCVPSERNASVDAQGAAEKVEALRGL